MNMESTQTMNKAAESGDLKLLISLHKQGHQLEETLEFEEDPLENALEIAAENGHLHILKYFRHSWNTNVFRRAAEAGNLHIVKYLHKKGCPWDHKVTAGAANAGHLQCLKYLHNNGCPLDDWATSWAIKGGQLECLKYLHQNGCPLDKKAIEVASMYGQLDCLQYLHQNGYVIKEKAIQYAAEGGHLDCLIYLCENLPVTEIDTYWIDNLVANNRSLRCLQYIIENGGAYNLESILNELNYRLRLDYDQDFDYDQDLDYLFANTWLRDFVFPHIDSTIMPEKLNDICKQKLAQINLEKQTTQAALSDTLSLDVVKHCLHAFI